MVTCLTDLTAWLFLAVVVGAAGAGPSSMNFTSALTAAMLGVCWDTGGTGGTLEGVCGLGGKSQLSGGGWGG